MFAQLETWSLMGRTLLIAKVLFAGGILHEPSQSIDIQYP